MITNLWNRIQRVASKYWDSLSFVGVILAATCFAASMTPSLLPRSFTIQGLLSGFAIAFGYGCGVVFDGIWVFLQFKKRTDRFRRAACTASVIFAASLMVFVLWKATVWQNSIRQLMHMSPVDASYPIATGLLAIVVGMFLIAVGRLLFACCVYVAEKLNHFVPKRAAYIIAVALVLFAAFTFTNNLVARSLLSFADSSFARIDELTDRGVQQPTAANKSGSPQSLVDWDSIGRRGKQFVVSGPTEPEISNFHQRECMEPLRIYVGLRSRDDMKQRAALALEELHRTRAFERSVLVIATPTGTGWIDPSAADTLEYLHAGDTAIVTLQYSYLPSWLTIIVDPERPRQAARLLFDAVYDHWKSLPKSTRPKLYLQGLSLGALGSEMSADLLTIFEDPIDGALWSGPPFPSAQWASLTKSRNEGSPSWRPEIRDGRMVRFIGQSDGQEGTGEWGPIRNVYLQYASDPMVFFSPDLAFSEPDWLKGDRGPDVSESLTWFPVVTSLQIAFDLPLATTVPMGYGHNYAPADYIEAWMMVTEPNNFSSADVARLKTIFAHRQPASF